MPRPIIPKSDLDRIHREATTAARSVATFAVFGGVLTGVTIGNADRINLVAGTALVLGIVVALAGVAAAIDGVRSTARRAWRFGHVRAERDRRAAMRHAPRGREAAQ